MCAAQHDTLTKAPNYFPGILAKNASPQSNHEKTLAEPKPRVILQDNWTPLCEVSWKTRKNWGTTTDGSKDLWNAHAVWNCGADLGTGKAH